MNNYPSAKEILERTSGNMVLLDCQSEAMCDLVGLFSLYGKRLRAMEEGEDVSLLPRVMALIYAPTGCGKTFLIRTLAKAMELGFVSIDSSSLTLTGYRGEDVNEAIIHGLRENGIDEKNPRAIILFDEFDKISTKQQIGEGNPQSNFLTLLEGGRITISDSRQGYSGINGENLLFLFCGAFEGIKKDKEKEPLGFSRDNSPKKQEPVTLEDVIDYGFSRELIGRIGSMIQFGKPEKADYIKLLREPGTGVEAQYRSLFVRDGIDFYISDAAASLLAEEALETDIGARAINAKVRETILPSIQLVDEDPFIHSFSLDVDENGELMVDYEWKDQERAVPQELELTPLDQNISRKLVSEYEIAKFSEELLTAAPPDKLHAKEELAFFYFLQIALRYLANFCNKNDQTLASIMKLAEITRVDVYGGCIFGELLNEIFVRDPMAEGLETIQKFSDCYFELQKADTGEYLIRRTERSLRALSRLEQEKNRAPDVIKQ